MAGILALGGCATAQDTRQQPQAGAAQRQALAGIDGTPGEALLDKPGMMRAMYAAMSRNPKLVYLAEVSPEGRAVMKNLVESLGKDPQTMTDLFASLLATATLRYEAIYGKIYMPEEAAPRDDQRVRHAQRRLLMLEDERRQAVLEGRQANIGALDRQIVQEAKEIWQLRESIQASAIK